MTLAEDQVLRKDESGRVHVQNKPVWAHDPKLMLSEKDVQKFANAGLRMPPRLCYGGTQFKADIVARDPHDVIYHFEGVSYPDFENLLEQVVESHFGSTDDFRIDYVPELKAWGLLAKGVRSKPLFNLMHYTEGFLHLLDEVLRAAKEKK